MINPTPWAIEFSSTGSGRINAVTDANGGDVRLSGVSTTNGLEAAQTTARVVRAVNSFDEMAAALRTARSQLVTLSGDPGDDADGDQIQAAVLGVIDAALAGADPA